jgi:hypothetical protein
MKGDIPAENAGYKKVQEKTIPNGYANFKLHHTVYHFISHCPVVRDRVHHGCTRWMRRVARWKIRTHIRIPREKHVEGNSLALMRRPQAQVIVIWATCFPRRSCWRACPELSLGVHNRIYRCYCWSHRRRQRSSTAGVRTGRTCSGRKARSLVLRLDFCWEAEYWFEGGRRPAKYEFYEGGGGSRTLFHNSR